MKRVKQKLEDLKKEVESVLGEHGEYLLLKYISGLVFLEN